MGNGVRQVAGHRMAFETPHGKDIDFQERAKQREAAKQRCIKALKAKRVRLV